MRIIVIGGGISGLSVTWSLVRQGHQVTLLEQGSIPNPLSASGDHHRIIRRAYPGGSGYGDAITDAYDAWYSLWSDLGKSHYDHRGFLLISRQQNDEAELYRQGLDNGGYGYELLQNEEAVERYPFLLPGCFRYVCFSPEGGALHCRRIATDIVEWLRRNGATVRENAKVDAVDTMTARVTLSDGDSIEADRIVVTAGAWVLRLFPELQEHLTTYRTAVVYLDPPAELISSWASAPVILDVGGETDGYVIPPSGGAGLKFGSGLYKMRSADPDARRVAEAGEGVVIRDLFSPPFARIDEYEVTDVVTCAYTFTKDERFFSAISGKSLIVSACSGHGYKFGPAVGRWIADYVDTGDFDRLQRRLRAEPELPVL